MTRLRALAATLAVGTVGAVAIAAPHAGTVATPAGAATASASAASLRTWLRPSVAAGGADALRARTAYATAPSPQECLAHSGSPCYSPRQLLPAYGVSGLQRSGTDGRGRTICILDSFGSPTAAADLAAFSSAYGLPQARLTIVAPAGPVPRYDNSDERSGWAGETSLDLQWAHAFAPRAAIRLIVTPTAETEGITGFPEMAKALSHEISHNTCDVVSMSFGATEPTFDSARQVLALRRTMFVPAAARGVTLLSASGDTGAVDYKKDMTLYRSPVDSWPSTDPLVTSVGGTKVALSDTGVRTSADAAWGGGSGASGGGVSSIFARPSYQDPVRAIVGSRRGTPDISMDAAPESGVVVRETFDRNQVAERGAWAVEGGTSAATPMMAGIVALTDQRAGKRIGQLGPLLYGALQHGAAVPTDPAGSGIVDVRLGRTDIRDVPNPDGTLVTARGHGATAGYDLATGLGTVNAATFVPALAAAARHA